MTSAKCFAVTISVFLATILFVHAAGAAQRPPLSADEIKAALRTTEIEDKGFVEAVVQLVNENRLSRKVVVSSFQWARKKSHYRFQYFKYSVLARLSAGERSMLGRRIESNRRQSPIGSLGGA